MKQVWVVMIVFFVSGWLTPHDPQQQYRENASMGPRCGEPCFLLGTDSVGRDVLSRTLRGGQLSLIAGLGAASLAILAGGLLGGISGLRMGWIDEALSRPMEVVAAMPWLYVLLAARAAMPFRMEPELILIAMMGLLGVAGISGPFRLARNAARSAMESDSVRAAFGLGLSRSEVLRSHLIPATLPSLREQWLVLVPQFVIAEVSLSFLGLGVSEPAVSWGTMLSALREYPVLAGQWWMFAPAVALAAFTLLLRYGSKSGEKQ